RCDAREPDLIDQFLRYVDRPELRYVTISDVRRDPERYRHLERLKKIPETDIDAALASAAATENRAKDNRRRLIALCQERNLPFASHDDTTAAQISEAAGYGLTISEFPITMESAKASHAAGMTNIVGGPNLVTGRSHVGNVSVRELAR